MAEIPKSVEIDLVISDKTADGMCRLLSDYLNEHWEKDLVVNMLQGDGEIRREVFLIERS